VELRPQDHVAGRDPQLERALEEVRRLLSEQAPVVPEFGERPRLLLPTLPTLPRLDGAIGEDLAADS
jgi:tricorn protease